MNIPKTIKIGGTVYDVIHDDTGKNHGDGHAGSIIFCYAKIFISNTSNQQVQEQALIHEILEAIDNGNDLQLPHQTISTIGECLYQVLKDNKLF